MKHSTLKNWILLALLCGNAIAARAQSQGTAFTYQGRLTDNGSPASGLFDLRCALFGGSSGGSAVAGPLTNAAVAVSNGVFTVPLDFGASVFTGADRWLDIAVRPAGNGAFTPLNPRQPVTATPYALTALNAMNVPGVTGHSLNAADGSPANAVFVDNDGKVGVGTTIPASRFHVDSASGDLSAPRLESSSTTRFNAGWDFYHGGTGKGYVGVPDVGASFAPGELILFGGPSTPVSLWPGQTRALTVMPDGDVRLGANSQLHATSGEENLRIVRGVVSGTGQILKGTGFQVIWFLGGAYRITFDTPFADAPTLTATPMVADSRTIMVMFGEEGVTASKAVFFIRDVSNDGVNAPFHFIANLCL